MATALKHKLSYHRRLFLLLLVFSWTLVGCFILFQYGREKHFKAERLDAQLQLFNLRMLDAVNAGAPPDAFIARSGAPCEGVRVTLIDPAGHVVFDNSLDTLPGANHLDHMCSCGDISISPRAKGYDGALSGKVRPKVRSCVSAFPLPVRTNILISRREESFRKLLPG